jgi:ligand-binding sensor domain-containing protein
MRNYYAIPVFILIGVTLAWAARAQEYSYVHYDVKDGLAGSTVYSMVQDKDGFMWFGTEAGLSRFDGTHFKTYTTADGLPDNEIIKVQVGKNDRLWILPFKNSLAYYRKGKIYNQQNDPMLKRLRLEENVRFIVEDKVGNLLICEATAATYVDTSGRITRFDNLNGQAFDVVLGQVGDDGSMQLILNHMYQFNYGRIDGHGFVETRPNVAYYNAPMAFYPVDSLEIHCFDSAIHFYNPRTKSDYRLHSPKGFLNVSVVTDSSIFINTSTGTLLFNIRNKKITDSFMIGQTVNAVTRDSEGDTWFSVMGNGVYRLVSSSFINYTFRQKNTIMPIFSIFRSGSDLCLGSEHFTLFTLSAATNHIREQTISHGPTRGRIIAVLKDPRGGVILGTDAGIVGFRNGRSIDSSSQQLSVKSLGWNDDSTMLVSCSRATELYGIHGSTFKKAIVEMRSTCSYRDDSLYYIGTLNGLVIVGPHEQIIHPGDKFRELSSRVTDIKRSRNGIIWISTNGAGLVGYRNGKVIATIRAKDGLTSDLCQKLFIAGNDIWVGTDKGLNRISDPTGDNRRILNISSLDGLGSDLINSIYVEDEKVFAGTSVGMTAFDVGKIGSQSICNLLITGITAAGHEWAYESTGLTLPHKDNDVQFDFVGISYRSGGNITYRYRLLALDTTWKTTTRTSLNFLSVPSGTYRLELQAINKFGVKSNPVAIAFTIEKLFWERNWFRAAVLLLLAGGLWLAFSIRVRAIRKKEKEKSEAVTRMAELEQMALRSQMNPHFIFNSLNSIQQYVMDKDVLGVNEFITKFSGLIRQTLDFSSRGRISLREEINYLTTYLDLEKTRFEDRFVYELCVPGDIQDQELYLPPMILQPYVENAIRHGMGLRDDNNGKIRISVRLEGDYLACTIEDNGVGRQAAARAKSRNSIQYQSQGMKLTEKRVAMFNQTSEVPLQIRIEDLEDQLKRPAGTRITVLFPCGQNIQP